MSGFKNVNINPATISMDASARMRVSQSTTLHDGKVINSDNTFLFCSGGTGTHTWTGNTVQMGVTAGQYVVRQTKRFSSYSSGKSQQIECTFNNFQIETGTTKKVGYFSSSASAPYTGQTDGFYLENDGTTIRLKSEDLGTITLDVPMSGWTGYDLISSYDWSKFTVISFDFIWLGGALLRFFMDVPDIGLTLIHEHIFAGELTTPFIHSPNQPIRYTLRSTTGSGSLTYICSQVSTEGSIDESGFNHEIHSRLTAAIPSNTVATIGTSYPLLGVRKKTANRDNSIKVTGADIFCSSANDILHWSLQLNPTLSAPLSWSATTNGVEIGYPGASAAISLTVTANGRELTGGFTTQNQVIAGDLFSKDFFSYLGCDLNNVMDELVLVITPITSNITLNGLIKLKEY